MNPESQSNNNMVNGTIARWERISRLVMTMVGTVGVPALALAFVLWRLEGAMTQMVNEFRTLTHVVTQLVAEQRQTTQVQLETNNILETQAAQAARIRALFPTQDDPPLTRQEGPASPRMQQR